MNATAGTDRMALSPARADWRIFGENSVLERQIRNTYFKYRFDFDIGYLVRSPCKDCEQRELFPRCIDTCEILDRIHAAMAQGISCSRIRS
jgi:hypothetical protein